ncbi:hypothetical protein PH5382_01265 [Phaeobacter sp. CECT 5382]|uniref:hypothetical protein n=1 Tax=Phaeobacter sp. CECT 5382 TaxID=1712645 RepID=UPI0006D9E388|nr:hypothetical protein [Phaeobacter sp. CECT 5382]CUH87339.1 hypothetical protein PH5382_01265 [Phaeobacter sp. CECT 5382]
MRTVEVAGALGALRANMMEDGFTIREVGDVSTIPSLIERIGKPYLTPISNPLHNDFTEGNSIWLVAEKDGEPVYLGCARLEDLGSESVSRYWSRVLSRAYSEGGRESVIENVRPEVDKALGGRIVYFGDLFVKLKGRGSRRALRSFVAIGHLAVSLKWNPDWIYCFVREADILRGAAILYGFTTLFPNPFHWVEPPFPRDNSEWLAALPRSEVWYCAEAALSAARGGTGSQEGLKSNHQKRKVQDEARPIATFDG